MEIGETTKETGNDQQTDEMDTDWLIMVSSSVFMSTTFYQNIMEI